MKGTLTDRIMAVFAYAVIAGFLGILIWYVPRTDLGVVIIITLLVIAWDFFAPERSGPT